MSNLKITFIGVGLMVLGLITTFPIVCKADEGALPQVLKNHHLADLNEINTAFGGDCTNSIAISDVIFSSSFLHAKPSFDGTAPANTFMQRAEKPTDDIVYGRDRSFFIDLAYQTGSISAYTLGMGLVLNDLLAGVGYSYSGGIYRGEFFQELDKDYELTFHGLNAGLSYDIVLLSINSFGLFLSPGVDVGIEVVKNDNLLNSEEVSYLMNYLLRPGVKLGIYVLGIDLYAGANYYQWLSTPMNMERIGLYDADTQEALIWYEDLFPGRKGLQLQFGIRFNF